MTLRIPKVLSAMFHRGPAGSLMSCLWRPTIRHPDRFVRESGFARVASRPRVITGRVALSVSGLRSRSGLAIRWPLFSQSLRRILKCLCVCCGRCFHVVPPRARCVEGNEVPVGKVGRGLLQSGQRCPPPRYPHTIGQTAGDIRIFMHEAERTRSCAAQPRIPWTVDSKGVREPCYR